MTMIIQLSQDQKLKELECLDNKQRKTAAEAVFFLFFYFFTFLIIHEIHL